MSHSAFSEKKPTKFDKNLHISFVTQYYSTCITIAI